MTAARSEACRVRQIALPTTKPVSRRVADSQRTENNEAVYFAGPENRLVAAAVTKHLTAAKKNNWAAGPMALIGPPGCGKSLLASGLAAGWAAEHDAALVQQTTGLDLRRHLERTLADERRRPGAVSELSERLRGLRLLVLEDLEGVAESPAAIDLLTTLVDRLAESNNHLVVTASKPLGEIAGLTPRLVGRIAAGVTLQVAAPAEAARKELLSAVIASRGGAIDSSAATEIAAWLPADARRVLTIAEQLYVRFGTRTRIGRGEAIRFLSEASKEEGSTPLSDIAGVVARYYSMSLRTLRSSSRKAPVVLARAMTIYLARQLTPLSYDEIGRYLGGRDHTTVMHNYNRINAKMPTDRALRSAIEDLLRRLGRADLITSTTQPAADSR